MSIFLGLGSNVGNRFENLRFAIERLTASKIQVIQESKIYETLPMYNTEQDNFLNQVIEVETSLLPLELLEVVKDIESDCGRQKNTQRNSPRALDIDILTYSDKIVNLSGLQIPHIKLKERDFVLKPWTDIAPSYIIPGENYGVQELLDKISESTILETYPSK